MDEFERWQQESPADPVATQGSSFDLIGILNRRKWWILFFLLVGLFVGFAYNLYSDPVYTSQARITISRRAMLDRQGSSNPNMFTFIGKEELETFALTLGSGSTAYAAMKEFKLDEIDSFRGLAPDAVLQGIVDGISVSRGDTKYEDANVINLGFTCKVPADCRKVINAMISVFQANLQGGYLKTTEQVREIYQKIRTDTEARLVNLKNQYRQLQRESPFILEQNGASNTVPYVESRRALEDAEKSLMEVDYRYRSAVQKLKDGFDREAVLNWLISDERNKDWTLLAPPEQAKTLQSLDEKLVDLKVALQTAIRKFGSKHPDVLAIKTKIDETTRAYDATLPKSAAINEDVAAAKQASTGRQIADPILRETLSYDSLYHDGLVGGSFYESRFFDVRLVGRSTKLPNDANENSDFLERRLKATLLAVEAATQKRDMLAQKAQQEEQKAKQIQTASIELHFLSQEIADQQKRLDIAVEQLRQIEVSPRDGYVVNRIKEPGYGTKTGPSLPLNLVLGGLAFGLFGFGVAFFIDRADRSFRSPEEIRRSLGVPVVGHIPVFFAKEDDELDPQLPPPSPSIDRMVCTYSDPDIVAAEAYRGVRTNLYFSTHGESHKLIQVTSPSAEDGKSTLAANLAVSLAQSGVKVLLMDADLRRPKVHQMFGVDKDAGLSNLIRGKIDLPEAIHSLADIENLDVMPAGPRPRNPSELLTLPKFKELLAALRDRYDFVIVDSPPILAVTDPGAIAAQVDGVLLALQIRRRAKPSAIRAVEILTELGANVLGVVVNGVGWKRAYAYRDGGTFGSGSKFYRYSADFRGTYSLADAYAYGPATIEHAASNGELLDASAKDRANAV